MKTIKNYVAALILVTAFGGAVVAQQKGGTVHKTKDSAKDKKVKKNTDNKNKSKMAVKTTGVPQNSEVKKAPASTTHTNLQGNK